jgi:hypothetical protein
MVMSLAPEPLIQRREQTVNDVKRRLKLPFMILDQCQRTYTTMAWWKIGVKLSIRNLSDKIL